MTEINHEARAHALLSPSSAHRWLNCTAAPMAESQYEDESSDFAAEGTLAHEVAQVYAEAVRHGMPELADGMEVLRAKYGNAITREMEECAEGYVQYIQEHTGNDSVVLLEQRLDFSNWVPEGFGTGDCIIIEGGTLTIIDYKYGQGVAVYAEDNPQMKIYALGAINDYGMVFDFDNVRMAIYQPRINNISEYTMSVKDLLDWANNVLVPKAAEAYSGKGEYVAGDHCRFCKHAGRCRAFSESCCDFVEHHGLRVAVPHLTDAEYLAYFKQKKVIELWIKRMDKVILDRMLAGDKIEGLKLVAGRSSRSWANEAEAMHLLGEEGLDFEEITEPAKLKSPAALEKAIGKKRVAELVGGLIETKTGNPTPAEASDKRQEFDPAADFNVLD